MRGPRSSFLRFPGRGPLICFREHFIVRHCSSSNITPIRQGYHSICRHNFRDFVLCGIVSSFGSAGIWFLYNLGFIEGDMDGGVITLRFWPRRKSG